MSNDVCVCGLLSRAQCSDANCVYMAYKPVPKDENPKQDLAMTEPNRISYITC